MEMDNSEAELRQKMFNSALEMWAHNGRKLIEENKVMAEAILTVSKTTVLSYKGNYSGELKRFKIQNGDGATEFDFITEQIKIYNKINSAVNPDVPHEKRAMHTCNGILSFLDGKQVEWEDKRNEVLSEIDSGERIGFNLSRVELTVLFMYLYQANHLSNTSVYALQKFIEKHFTYQGTNEMTAIDVLWNQLENNDKSPEPAIKRLKEIFEKINIEVKA